MYAKWQYLSIFFKIANDEDPFHVHWYGGENRMCQGIQECTK